ncbi:SRPBCC family protein [Frankia sp. AgKG'84/4]|uniref:SRPBCC family protein n=1 Tax=Frankia sp. AgKG'84/4 TaxID=573490 RepID=UPI00200DEC5B|nr:SRPBCC family protein [Frankia sp. AgKG'84/4]MCL9796264.1 SRPBCC family protein [Frankia sp. AgKG'84/4]
MATVSRLIGAPASQVWAVLDNGWTYSRWVVGTGAIRAVDLPFPEAGARLHYQIGRWPLAKKGVTTCLRHDAPAEVELEAEGWPLGTVHITLAVTEQDGGTLVAITEHPKRGLARAVHNPVLDRLIWLRNVETLRRLEKAVLGQP